jgi:FkbM family methyltransferase
LKAVPPTPLHRAAARLRQIIGVEGVPSQLDRIEQRLDRLDQATQAIQAARWPHGPVYLGDHEALVQARWGAKLVVDTRDRLLAPWLLMDGLWESHVTGWLHDTLAPGAVMVDVGANIGYFTVLAAQLVGTAGRVVAVEASPGLCDIIRRNVAMNGHRDTVTVWNRAAWSGPDRLRLHQRVHYGANSSLASAGSAQLEELADEEVVVEVEAVALDDLLADLEKVDVLKLDVEGAEVHAVKGLAGTLAAHPGITLMIEWAPEQIRLVGDGPEELVALLTGAGFRFRLMEDGLAPIEPTALLELAYGNVVAART